MNKLASSSQSNPAVVVEAPRVEHMREPFGIGEARPRLSFVVASAPVGWVQAAYEVEIASPDGGVPSRSGRMESAESVLVPWPAPALSSRERRIVRVRAWGRGEAEPSEWSPAATLEAGLLDPADWSAQFVGPDWPIDPAVEQTPPQLRTEFDVDGKVVRARAYATALGLYELEINGSVVGDQAMTPGWTSYLHRLRYQSFDITPLLQPGRNALGATLAEGWYAGRLTWGKGMRNVYGDRVALQAQVEIEYADGRRQVVATDGSWRSSAGPLLASGIYDGESYDARREMAGWSKPGFDDGGWQKVRVVDRGEAVLEAPMGPAVRCTQELPVAKVVSVTRERIVLDFGQNLVGRCRIRVSGPAGTQVRLRHAEVLADGEVCVKPLRAAKATDTYTLAGRGVEEWEPRFTFHGFRYAEITGWPGEFDLAAVVARVYHTDMERTGWFECSDPLVNQLHENVIWSMRGNFLDVPTDCPQRDERMGWTGDIAVFGPTASFLFDCAGMLSSWLRDVAAEQLPDGTIPFFVPMVPTAMWEPTPTAVWGDAAVLVPWTLYERFGDAELLRREYPTAKRFVDLVIERAGPSHLWDTGRQLGDWLDPSAPPDDPADAKADRYLVATAYFANSTRVLATMAGILGLQADAERYSSEADAIVDAFRCRYLEPSGLLTNDAQTSYALALRFGLIPEGPQRQAAVRRFVELVEAERHTVQTGFAGTPMLCDALSANGAPDTAYAMLLNRECPGWLYSVTQGATTVWERWDSLQPDGTVNPGQMTSFNHYALGAVADWLHRFVAGLAPAAPGYRRLSVRPRPGGGIDYAAATLRTPYGRVELGWRLKDGALEVDLMVPVGAGATVDLPGMAPFEVAAGRHRFRVPVAS